MALIDKSPWDSNAVFIFFCHFCNLVPKAFFFLREKPWGRGCHFWPVPCKTEDPFRSFSKLFLQFSRNFPSRVENISTLKGNFVSPRGHVISSIVTCDQAIFFGGGAGEKNNISPAKKKKSPDRRLPLLKRACFGSWLTERGILLLRRACLALWLIERGILHFKCAN